MLILAEGLPFFFLSPLEGRSKPGPRQAQETVRSTAHPLLLSSPRRGRGEGGLQRGRSHWLDAAASGAGDTSDHSIIDGPVMNICSPLTRADPEEWLFSA